MNFVKFTTMKVIWAIKICLNYYIFGLLFRKLVSKLLRPFYRLKLSLIKITILLDISKPRTIYYTSLFRVASTKGLPYFVYGPGIVNFHVF